MYSERSRRRNRITGATAGGPRHLPMRTLAGWL
jgi:hypothetical protein